MRALCWEGIGQVGVHDVAEPGVVNPNDALVRVNLSSVCGSDLHLIRGHIATLKRGDILGHEFVGEIVETGSAVRKFKKGDRVVVGPTIGCGACSYCLSGLWALCDNSNPNTHMLEKQYGGAPSGMLGYAHGFGGYPGSHAEYIRVPFIDHGAFPIPAEVSDEKAIFVSCAFPAGYMAADMADIRPGDIVAVWGCGAIGLLAIQSAFLLGAGRVIAIDRIQARLSMAQEICGAEILNYEKVDIPEALITLAGGRGPDRCIDAVGMQAQAAGIGAVYDKVRHTLSEIDPSVVLREAVQACRKGGTISIVGMYAGITDKFLMGAAMNKGLTFKMGRAHTQKYIPTLMEHIVSDRIDPSYLITHRLSIEEGPLGYEMFEKRRNNCLRAVFTLHH